MSKKKQKRRSKKIWISTLCVLLLVIMAAVIWILSGKDRSKNNVEDSKTASEQESTEPPKSTELFDDGRLKLIGGMEYEGPNFDDGSMEEDVYTMLKIQNVSDSFLRKADIEVKVNDSEQMKLTIDSLPVGATVMVIGQDYTSYSEDAVYQVLSCKSSYEESVADKREGLDVTCEMGKIRVTNQSAEDVSNVTFRYKGKVDEMLLGGIAYEFTIDSLAAGQTFETDSQSFLAETIQVIEVK